MKGELSSPRATRPASPFHASRVEAVAGRLGTDPVGGLTEVEAASRLRAVGANVIEEGRRTSPLRLLAEQFAEPIVPVLLAAAAISGLALGQAFDAAVILAVVVLNAALGFGQEARAEQALARLQAMAAPTASVTRDGFERRIAAAALVPGDLISLRAGDRAPADARLVEARHLAMGEAILTGEAFPAEKSTHPVATGAAVADRASMVHMGTTVRTGRGLALVTATGRSTAIGQIAGLLSGKPPPTRLQVELGRVGRVIGAVALVTVGAVFLLGWLEGYPAHAMFLTAVALAVAAVPEGLPAVVTITLARGVQRLARRRAIVRRLQAVETLGAATVICIDKTGTLTRDRIEVAEVLLDGLRGAPGSLPKGDPRVMRYAEIAALCNDASPGRPDGDPVEVALLQSLEALGLAPDEIRAARPRLDEVAFEPGRRLMSTLHEAGPTAGAWLLAVKGAPEVVLARSSAMETAGGPRPLSEPDRRLLLAEVRALAAQGMRTLALAYRRLDAIPEDLARAEEQMTLAGLAALSDELRPEAAGSVAAAQGAGIRVVMVTGDHAETAATVARQLGILSPELEVMEGERLAGVTDEHLRQEVDRYGAYARVDPADKVKIVRAWQGRGEVVAMTGDGVNDAPALHGADIGVAMGSGTDVSRDAAAIVLADDNFATLVGAVEEGRAILDNLRRVIHFLLTTNTSEVLVMSLGFLFFGGLGAPLLPTQILWVNLVTDGLPVLALAAEPPAPGLMRRTPERDRAIAGFRQLAGIPARAGILAAAALAALAYGHYLARAEWAEVQTLVFTVLVTLQLAYAFHVRAGGLRARRGTRGLVMTALGSLALQVAVVSLPVGNAVFHTIPLGVTDWLVALALTAAAMLAIGAIGPVRRLSRILPSEDARPPVAGDEEPRERERGHQPRAGDGESPDLRG